MDVILHNIQCAEVELKLVFELIEHAWLQKKIKKK